jgi:phospholipid/cholesterol/gamma-HCH transport system ATP-binding protein
MIEVKNLVKSFDGREVIKDVSTTFEAGKVNMVIGRSGSGKTVFLKCMVGLIIPDSGSVLYDGRDFTTSDEDEKMMIRREMGKVFQMGALFDSMTVAENVRFPLEMFSKMSEAEKKERVEFCLEKVNLTQAHNLYPSEISGGMKKRTAIARAISLNPKYLFCDEPNSGLDPETSILIDNLVKDLTHEFNMTTVIISHDMNSVFEIGEKVMFLYKGENVWEGNGREIAKAEHPALREFVFASELMKKLHNIT